MSFSVSMSSASMALSFWSGRLWKKSIPVFDSRKSMVTALLLTTERGA